MKFNQQYMFELIRYYLGLTPYVREISLTTVQQQYIEKQIPGLYQIPYDTLLGGSMVMKVFTQRDFEVNDIDVFIKANDISEVSAHLAKIYGSQFRIRLASDNPARSTITDEGVEEFDKAILGTVNFTLPSEKKLQFVVVDTEDLDQWYLDTSDLPVYAVMLPIPSGSHFYFTGSTLAMTALKYGYFTRYIKRPRHQFRIEKYMSKGFAFL